MQCHLVQALKASNANWYLRTFPFVIIKLFVIDSFLNFICTVKGWICKYRILGQKYVQGDNGLQGKRLWQYTAGGSFKL